MVAAHGRDRLREDGLAAAVCCLQRRKSGGGCCCLQLKKSVAFAPSKGAATWATTSFSAAQWRLSDWPSLGLAAESGHYGLTAC